MLVGPSSRRIRYTVRCPTVCRVRRRTRAYGYTEPHFTGSEWHALVEVCGYRCLACGVLEALTVDHVVPLCLGGSNAIENIQPLCGSCNNAKGCEVADYR